MCDEIDCCRETREKVDVVSLEGVGRACRASQAIEACVTIRRGSHVSGVGISRCNAVARWDVLSFADGVDAIECDEKMDFVVRNLRQDRAVGDRASQRFASSISSLRCSVKVCIQHCCFSKTPKRMRTAVDGYTVARGHEAFERCSCSRKRERKSDLRQSRRKLSVV